MCGIIGIVKQHGSVNVEIYEGLLMLQHRGQDSAGMVTTDWSKFREYKNNGLVKDVFSNKDVMDKLQGELRPQGSSSSSRGSRGGSSCTSATSNSMCRARHSCRR
jgi:amidophosphoribosyltransferase